MSTESLTPEQLAQRVELEAAEQKRLDFIKELAPEEILEQIADLSKAVTLVLDGYNYATVVTESGGISLGMMTRMQQMLSAVYHWISANTLDESEEESTEDKETSESL